MWTLHQNHPGRRTVFTLGTGSFFNSHRVNVNICKHADTHLLSHITSWTLRDPRLDGRRANNRSQKPEGLLTFRLHPNLHYLDLQTEPGQTVMCSLSSRQVCKWDHEANIVPRPEDCSPNIYLLHSSMFLYHDVVTFHFWPQRFNKCFKIIKTVKSAEVCTKSSWAPADWINCGFEQPSRLPDFPAKSASLQVWWSPDIWRNVATFKLDQQSERNEYELDSSKI